MSAGGHLDDEGRLRMVDVSGKSVTSRRAVAACVIRMQASTVRAIAGGEVPKGDVFAVAQVAGVMAAKRTPELIPGCHPVRISGVDITFSSGTDSIEVTASIRGDDRTGFEMEALTACSLAALTVYDMCKGIDPGIEITGMRLVSKEGGKSGRPRLDGISSGIVTVSTKGAAGEREDTSGAAIRSWLEARGAVVDRRVIVPDDRAAIAETLRALAAEPGLDLIVTTGGTGVSPTDVTPEATADAADRIVPGLAEVMRDASLRSTPMAMISRGIAATIGATLVLNLPGSPKAVAECLDAVEPALQHAVELLRGSQPH